MNRANRICLIPTLCWSVLLAAPLLILTSNTAQGADPTLLTSPVATLRAVGMGLRFTEDPDNSRLIIADWSGPITVWDWQANTTRILSRESIARETTATAAADSVDRIAAFALVCTAAISDDKKLYIAGNSLYRRPYIGSSVEIISLVTSKLSRTLNSSNPRHNMDEGGFALFVDSQNNIVTCCAADGLCLWDFASGKRTKRTSHSDYSVMCGGVLREKKTLRFWGSRTGYSGFRLFDWNWETDEVAVAPGCPEDLFQTGGGLTIDACFHVSQDGRRTVYPGPPNQKYWVIRDMEAEGPGPTAATGTTFRDYLWDPVSEPRSLTFSSDGLLLAAGDTNNVVRIWRFPAPKQADNEKK